MKRLDPGHLHPKVLRLTYLGRVSNPGLRTVAKSDSNSVLIAIRNIYNFSTNEPATRLTFSGDLYNKVKFPHIFSHIRQIKSF